MAGSELAWSVGESLRTEVTAPQRQGGQQLGEVAEVLDGSEVAHVGSMRWDLHADHQPTATPLSGSRGAIMARPRVALRNGLQLAQL